MLPYVRRAYCDVTLPLQQNFWIGTIGSLSISDNGDGNKNSKKPIGLH